MEGILRAKLEDLKEEILTDFLSIVIHQLLEGHFSDVLKNVEGLGVKPNDKVGFEKAVQRVVGWLKK